MGTDEVKDCVNLSKRSVVLKKKYHVFCKFRDIPLECITDPSLLDFHAKVPRRAAVFAEGSGTFPTANSLLKSILERIAALRGSLRRGDFHQSSVSLRTACEL